jgi:hypothetical protein
MPLQQLKDFMASNPDSTESIAPEDSAPDAVDTAGASTEDTSDEGVQEAFFLTRGNIGKELDIHLRKSLGILNSSDMEIDQLCRAFRKEGSKLNRVVHKATKMPTVFNEQEIKQLKVLNQCTADLMKMMRSDLDTNGVAIVKRLIQAFVQSATGVLKLIERHKDDKHVQEAATESLVQIPDDYAEFLKSGEYKKYKNICIGDEVSTIEIKRFLSEAEIQAHAKKLDGIKAYSPNDGKLNKYSPIPIAIITEDIYHESKSYDKNNWYIVILPEDSIRYCSLLRTSDGVPGLFKISKDFKRFKELIDDPIK